MSRYAKANVTEDELREKIESKGGIYEMLYNNPTQQLIDDMKKVNFDCENVLDEEDLDGDYDYFGLNLGYETLDNGVPVLWVAAGGDWELPLALCIYIGEKGELRAYIPKEGNRYNLKEKCAYGSEENPPDDFSEHEDEEFDMDKLRSAAVKRIVVR